jgi:hypothetical protein
MTRGSLAIWLTVDVVLVYTPGDVPYSIYASRAELETTFNVME